MAAGCGEMGIDWERRMREKIWDLGYEAGVWLVITNFVQSDVK